MLLYSYWRIIIIAMNLGTKIKSEPLKYIASFIVVLMFCSMFFIRNNLKNRATASERVKSTSNELMVFVQDGCPHCEHAEQFLSGNNEKSDDVEVVIYNLKDRESLALLFKNISRLNIPQDGLGTPIFIMGDEYIIGFGEDEKSILKQLLMGKKIRAAENK